MKIHTYQEKIINNDKYVILKSFLIFVLISAPIFAYQNMLRGSYNIAYSELMLSITLLITLFYFKKLRNHPHFVLISSIVLLLFFLVMSFIMFQPNASSTVFVWVFTAPFLSYSLLGQKLGFFATLFFSVSTMTLLSFHVFDIEDVNEMVIYNILACMIFLWFLAHIYESSNMQVKLKLARISSLDELTGLYNRKVLFHLYHKYVNSTFSVIVIDIDFFKKVNDQYGHDVGDKTLVFFAKELKSYFDSIGYNIRMGGEEFCVLLPNTDSDEATKLCNQFLSELNQNYIEHEGHRFGITFSAGVSEYPRENTNYSDLLKTADNRLYNAKDLGRNRVVSR